MKMSVGSKFIGRISLAVTGMILVLLLAEVTLRIAGFIFLSWQDYRNRCSVKQKGTYVLLCIGESTTANQYPPFLSEILNQNSGSIRFSVIDKGVPGIVTGQIASALEKQIEEYRPDAVLAMIGINDVKHYYDLDERAGSCPRDRFLASWRVRKLFSFLRQRLDFLFQMTWVMKQELMDKMIAGTLVPKNAPDNAGTHVPKEDIFKLPDMDNNAEPSDICYYDRMGALYCERNDFLKAEHFFRKAVEVNPDSDTAYLKAGCFYIMRGEYATARKYFLKTMAISKGMAGDFACGGLLVALEKTGDKNDLEKYKSIYRRTKLASFTDRVAANYRRIKDILDKRGIKLICAQYPMRDISPLKDIFYDRGDVVFIDNEKIFKDAVRSSDYREYFVDMIGGDFGHCTPRGNRLLAKNIAGVIAAKVTAD